MPNKNERASERIFFPNLDGLRFFAFFLVFLNHILAFPVSTIQGYGFLESRLVYTIFNSGWAGVSFFFVLSGFLITYLLLAEIDLTGRVDVKAFWIRRALRIWPLYYLVLLLGVVLVSPPVQRLLGVSLNMDAVNPLYYLFFFGNFDVMRLAEGQGILFINITWSVAIEEQFYLVWPLLFLFLPSRFYKFIFPVIVLISAVFRSSHLGEPRVLQYHTLSAMSDMATGAMMAYFTFRFARFRETIAEIPKWVIVAAYIFGSVLMFFREEIFVGSVLGTLERIVITMFFAFIVLEQNYCNNSFFKMSRLKIISKLGIYTYGLYLLHPLAIMAVRNIFKLLGVDSTTVVNNLVIAAPAALMLSIVVSFASYHLFERRFLKLKDRFTHVKTAQTPLTK